MHACDNQGPTNVNAVAGMPLSVSHASLLRMDAHAASEHSPLQSHTIHPSTVCAGEAEFDDSHARVRHNVHSPHRSSQHSRAVENASEGAEALSPLLGVGFFATAGDPGASFYVSAAPTAGGSEDGAAPDAKSQMLHSIHIHTPTTPTTGLMVTDEAATQNAASAVTLATQPATHPVPSPVITDSSSDPVTGSRTRDYAFSQLQQLPLDDESFLAAAAAPPCDLRQAPPTFLAKHEGGDALDAGATQTPTTEAPRSASSNTEQGSSPVDGPRGTPAKSPSRSAASASASSSVSSVPYSTAETQCHDTADLQERAQPGQLPLPQAVDHMTTSTSVSSFTVSSASATASPHPDPTHFASADWSAAAPRDFKSQKRKASEVGLRETSPRQRQQQRIEAAVRAELDDDDRSDAAASESADSPLVSLEISNTYSSLDSHSPNPSASAQAAAEVRSQRREPIPRPPQISAASKGSGGANSTQSKKTVSGSVGSGGANTTTTTTTTTTNTTKTQSSYYSMVTLDSGFVPRPRGSNLVGLRVPTPDSQALRAEMAKGPLQPFRRDTSGSPLTPSPTQLTSFAHPSTSTSNNFARTSSFALPTLMSGSGTTASSLAAFPKLDVPLRAAMAAAALASSSGSTASNPTAATSPVDRRERFAEVAGAVPPTETRVRLPPVPALSASRVAAPLQLDRTSSSTTHDDTRDSHRQLSDDGRNVDNSSFHSPSLPQQSSRAFTVTSASFAYDTQWYDAHSPRPHARARSSMHDSAVSLYYGSSMLSDNVLQTFTHGMALSGAPGAPWRSVVGDDAPAAASAASPNAAAAMSLSGSKPYGVGMPFSSVTDADSSMWASKSNNNACVRLPHYSPHVHPMNASWRASQASTAAGAMMGYPDSSLASGSYLLGTSSMLVPDAQGSKLTPFFASTRGLHSARSAQVSPLPPPLASASASQDAPLMGGRGTKSALSRPMGQPSATLQSTATAAMTAASLQRPDCDTPIPELSSPTPLPHHHPYQQLRFQQQQQQQQQQSSAPGSGSFFAAADDGPQDGGAKFNRSSTGDFPLFRQDASPLLYGQRAPGAGRARPHAATAAAAENSFAALTAPSSPLQAKSSCYERSSAPVSSMLSAAPSESTRMMAFPSDSPDGSAAEGLCEVSGDSHLRGNGGGGGVDDRPLKLPRGDGRRAAQHSNVARRRVPSGGFSAADSSGRPMAPQETSLEVQSTFLQSVHAATANMIGAPHGCSSALRHLFMGSSSSPSPFMAPSVFAHSFAGSTGGQGVFCGDGPSTDPSVAAVASPNTSTETPLPLPESRRDSAEGTLSLPEVKILSDDQEDETEPVPATKEAGDVSCSFASSQPPTASQLPQPLRGPTSIHHPSLSLVSTPAVAKSTGATFSEAMLHVLPLMELQEHSSLSGSSRLPTLHSLGSSTYHGRVGRAGEQVAASRQSGPPAAPRATRGRPAATQQAAPSTGTPTAATTSQSLRSSLLRSKPFASTYDESAAASQPSGAAVADDLLKSESSIASEAPAAVSAVPQTASKSSSRGSHHHHRNHQHSHSSYTVRAERGLIGGRAAPPPQSRSSVKESSSLGRDSSSRGLNRGVFVPPAHELESARPATTPAAAAAVAGDAEMMIQRSGAAEHRILLSIPSFHRYRDVESMLDDAETALRRAPVPIIPVLTSRITRALNPAMSGSMGFSVSGAGTSVLSLQTPAMTASTTSTARRTSASADLAEKRRSSRLLTEVSFSFAQHSSEVQESQ